MLIYGDYGDLYNVDYYMPDGKMLYKAIRLLKHHDVEQQIMDALPKGAAVYHVVRRKEA